MSSFPTGYVTLAFIAFAAFLTVCWLIVAALATAGFHAIEAKLDEISGADQCTGEDCELCALNDAP